MPKVGDTDQKSELQPGRLPESELNAKLSKGTFQARPLSAVLLVAFQSRTKGAGKPVPRENCRKVSKIFWTLFDNF